MFDFMAPFLDRHGKADLASRQGGEPMLAYCTPDELNRALTVYRQIIQRIEGELKAREKRDG